MTVQYESRLERSLLQLADFDVETRAIAAQPLQLSGRDSSGVMHHVPDLFITREGRKPLLVDVKPAEFARLERAARVFRWTATVCAAADWYYEVWTGEHDRARLRGIQAVPIARRRPLPDADVLARLIEHADRGTTIGDLEHVADVDRQDTMRAAWEGFVDLDLSVPVSTATKVTTR